MLRFRRFAPSLLAVLLLGAAASCSKADSAPPVATVSLSLSRNAVALGGVLDLTYRFQVAADAKISGDYLVFVHVNREDGTTFWNDDHALPEKFQTSQWKPGQVIEYTRTRFVPTFSYLGPATIHVGLYRDDSRLPLTGPDPADRDSPARSYKVATIELLPRTERIQVNRLSGWHGPEFAPDDPTVEWQWTQKVATFSLLNPKRDVTFFLDYDARTDLLGGQPQQINVFCGEARIATLVAANTSGTTTMERIPITAAQLGSGEMVELRLEIDRTFVPAMVPNAGTDLRELGIRVFHAVVEPR